jgi:hypothetical protein
VEFDIPGGRIIPTPDALNILGDPGRAYATIGAAEAYNALVHPAPLEAERPELRVVQGEVTYPAALMPLGVNGRGLVLAVYLEPEEVAYLYAREGLPGRPWLVASRMLVLPEYRQEWGEDDEAQYEIKGRVLLYLAQAELNRWLE